MLVAVWAASLGSQGSSVAAIPPSSYSDIWFFSEVMALVEKGHIVEVWKGELKIGAAVPADASCFSDRGVLVRAHKRWTCDAVQREVVSLGGPSEGEAPPYVTVEQLRGLGKTGKLPPWRMRANVLGRKVLITYDEDNRYKPIIVKGLMVIDLEATSVDFYWDHAYLSLKSPKQSVYLKGRLDRVKGGEVECTFKETDPAARSISELEALLR
jgi:hypothetical protein